MAFAKLKTLIRRAAARSYDALWRAVGQVCDLFSEEECYNFFKAAGYEADRPQHALILLGLFADHCLTALLMD
jgi:hypothetical protein